MKKRWYLLPILALLFFLLFFPDIAFAASKRGLLLWFQSLLPSLLPFMILSNILIQTNILERWIALPKRLWSYLFGLSPDGAYALLLGIFCGYPMGAKVTADLYQRGSISQEKPVTFSPFPIIPDLCLSLPFCFWRPFTDRILLASAFLSCTAAVTLLL